MDRPVYNPPKPYILRKGGTFGITGCSGFLVENLGTAVLHIGPVGEEIIPVNPGEAREFEAPEGGIYDGQYSIRFAGNTGEALILKNIGRIDSGAEGSGSKATDLVETLI